RFLVVYRDLFSGARTARSDIVADINSEPIKPWFKRFAAIEPVKILVNAKENFLNGFLGIGRIAEHSAGGQHEGTFGPKHSCSNAETSPVAARSRMITHSRVSRSNGVSVMRN